MNEQQATGTSAGLTLAERVTRWRRAMVALTRWDGWPVLDVMHLAYRRKQRGESLVANADDALGAHPVHSTEQPQLSNRHGST